MKWNTIKVNILPENPSTCTFYEMLDGSLWFPEDEFGGPGSLNYRLVYPIKWIRVN